MRESGLAPESADVWRRCVASWGHLRETATACHDPPARVRTAQVQVHTEAGSTSFWPGESVGPLHPALGYATPTLCFAKATTSPSN